MDMNTNLGFYIFLAVSYTELDVVVPKNEIWGLHTDNLVIDSVIADTDPKKF